MRLFVLGFAVCIGAFGASIPIGDCSKELPRDVTTVVDAGKERAAELIRYINNEITWKACSAAVPGDLRIAVREQPRSWRERLRKKGKAVAFLENGTLVIRYNAVFAGAKKYKLPVEEAFAWVILGAIYAPNVVQGKERGLTLSFTLPSQ